MALDWNKEIDFSALRRGGSSDSDYPSKTAMNLYQREGVTLSRGQALRYGILLVAFIALFTYFAVYTPLNAVSQKQAELSRAQAALAPISQQVSNYDAVQQEYNSYARATNSSGIDAAGVLNMIETQVKPKCTVGQITLKDTTLTLTLSDVSLDTVGSIVQDLGTQSGVSNVSVATAKTNQQDDSSGVVATLSITLSPAVQSGGN